MGRVATRLAAVAAVVACLALLGYAVYLSSYFEPTDAALERAGRGERAAFFAGPGLLLGGLALLVSYRRTGAAPAVAAALACAATIAWTASLVVLTT